MVTNDTSRSSLIQSFVAGTYPANQNKYSEYTDLMGERFISGIVMVDNWGETTPFISGTTDFKPSYNDTFTDVDTKYVFSSQTSHPNAWKIVDGKRSLTKAPSVVSVATLHTGGIIQLLVLLAWAIMPSKLWNQQIQQTQNS